MSGEDFESRLTHLEQVVRDLDQDVQDLQTLRRADAGLIREVARGLSEHRGEFREFREETREGLRLIAEMLRGLREEG